MVHEQDGEKILRLTLYKIPLPGTPAEVLQIEDISEKFELEEKLLHAKKLGTLGELLSRFTHEFNNLMTSLLGHLTMLKKEVGEGHPHFKRTLLIEDVALRAYNLGKDILDFSKKEKLKKEAMNVRDAIETVLNLLGKTVLKRIEVENSFADDGLTVLINKEKFLLALFNILINAKDAIWAAQREKGTDPHRRRPHLHLQGGRRTSSASASPTTAPASTKRSSARSSSPISPPRARRGPAWA